MSSPPSSFLNLIQMLALPESPYREALYQFGCDLRVACPGIVTAFDATKQTVSVQPVIREKMKQNTLDKSGSYIPTEVDAALPVLLDVPVVLPRAGGFTFTLPIKAGDECLVIFADRCFNAWWANGAGTGQPSQLANQEEKRQHDLSDALAIMGPWSQPRVLSAFSTTAAQIRTDGGSVFVEVGTNEITLTVDGGTTKIVITAGEIDINATTVKINGQNFHSHVHSGVTTGAGVTGPVTP